MASIDRRLSGQVDRHVAALVAGDMAAFLAFAVMGLASHGGLAGNLAARIVTTAAPFAAGWFAVAPFVGAYKQAAFGSPQRMLARTTLGWATGCLIGLALRGFARGQVPPVSFAIVTFLTVLLLLGGWRVAFTWLQTRQAGSPMTTTRLYLIRHGEAFSNVDGVIAGMKSDRGLTERGVRQAQALAARLATGEIAADVLYASTLPRARMTAEAVAVPLKLPIQWDDELHELRPGEADGLHVDQARAQFPEFSRFLREVVYPDCARRRVGVVSDAGSGCAGPHHPAASGRTDRGGGARWRDRGVVSAPVAAGPQARMRASFHVRNTAITRWNYSEAFGGRWEWHMVSHNDHRHLLEMDAE